MAAFTAGDVDFLFVGRNGVFYDRAGNDWDATIVSINTVLPHAQDKENENYTQLIEVALAYRKITWTHDAAKTQGSDDWRAPAA